LEDHAKRCLENLLVREWGEEERENVSFIIWDSLVRIGCMTGRLAQMMLRLISKMARMSAIPA